MSHSKTATAHIRPATIGDVPELVRLILELAEFEGMSAQVRLSEAEFRQHLFGPNPVCECLVAEIDGDIAGLAVFCHNFSTFQSRRGLYLDDLYVQRRYRGLGLGRKLVTQLAAIAIERNCGRFEWYVLDWNVAAIHFYKSVGADIVADLRVCRVAGDRLRDMVTN